MSDKQPMKTLGDKNEPLGADIPDEDLFKRAPKQEECPICFLTFPNESEDMARSYQPCCGKTICVGCRNKTFFDNNLCPFCRDNADEPNFIKCLEERVALGDSQAMYNLGIEYRKGRCVEADMKKAMQLFHQAAENGSGQAHSLLGTIYYGGESGVEVNTEKAMHHELAAAMGGVNISRHNIGVQEIHAGHVDRAMKHFFIAACDGYEPSLTSVKKGYTMGLAKKEVYAEALRAYQESIDAVKSKEREDGLKTLTMFQDSEGLAKYLRKNVQRKQQTPPNAGTEGILKRRK